MPTYPLNLEIIQGETFDENVYIQSADGGPDNLSNYTISGNLQYNYAAPGAYLQSFTTSVVGNGVNGIVKLFLTATETRNLPVSRLVYDVYKFDYQDHTLSRKILGGYANVYPSVTLIPSGFPTGCTPVTLITGSTGTFALVNGMSSFAGFVALRTDDSYFDGKTVIVTYGQIPGDSLKGLFIYNSGSYATDDNYDRIKPDNRPSGYAGRYIRFL